MGARPLLVRTPAQFADESPLNFVLRVSEANGYVTMSWVFDLAGIARRERISPWLDMGKVAQALGCGSDQVHGYVADERSGTAGFMLCGHPVTERELNTRWPRVCPECVIELGYVPAWVDLSMVDACPTHRRRFVSVCPSCELALVWVRPGLLTCKCGTSLALARGAPVTEQHAELLSHIVSRFGGLLPTNHFGMPADHFETMTLSRILAMSRNMALLHAAALPTSAGSTAQRAACLFSAWPHNLHTALRTVAPERDARNDATAFRNQATALYRTWMDKAASASDTAFLRDAITGFRDGAEGCEPLQCLASDEMPVAKPARAFRLLGPSTKKTPPPTPGERGLSARAAAKHIGIPTKVLGYLRLTGYFEVRHRAANGAHFHEKDVAAFERKLGAVTHVPSRTGLPPRSLAWAMQQKFKHASGKGEFIEAVLDGKIAVRGRQGPRCVDILLDAAQAEDFIAQAREAAFAGAYSASRVGELLHCEPLVVASLVATGHLKGRRFFASFRLTRQSVLEFSANYRSLAQLAQEWGTSSRGLMRQAAAAGVSLLAGHRAKTGAPQHFVRVADIDALKASPYRPRRSGVPVRSSARSIVPVGTSLTFQAVADAVECTPTVVPNLIAAGYLVQHDCVSGKRITQESVTDFLRRYRSLVHVARKHGIGTARLINEAARLGIKLLVVSRGIDMSKQYFLAAEDAERLKGPYETKVAARKRKSDAAKARRLGAGAPR